MGENYPIFVRHKLHQIALYFLRLLFGGQAEAFGQSRDVRVYDDAGGDAEGVAENDVGSFARDTGQQQQVFNIFRHASLILFTDETARALNGLRLVVIKTRRAYVLLKLCLRYAVIIFRAAIFPEEISGHDVDALIRTLRRQNGRNQKFKRIRVIERATRLRVLRFEPPDNLERSLFLFAYYQGMGSF